MNGAYILQKNESKNVSLTLDDVKEKNKTNEFLIDKIGKQSYLFEL